MTVARPLRVLAVAALVLALVAPLGAGAQTSPPDSVVPPPPEQVEPALEAVSPVVWEACGAVGLATGLVVLAGPLAGLPSEVTVPVDQLFGQLSGPALQVFFEACFHVPLPADAPECGTDESVPALPTLGRPAAPAGLLANEVAALEGALAGVGVPSDGALTDAVSQVLGCSPGDTGQSAPPPVGGLEPEVAGGAPPSMGTGTPPAPPVISGGTVPSFDQGRASGPDVAAGPPSAPGERLPAGEQTLAAQPASSGGDDGATVAYVLLGLAALAGLLWVAAGSAHPGAGAGGDGA